MSGQPSLNTIESAREAVSSSKYTEALNLLDELEDSGFVDAELYLLRGISFAQVGKAEAATESLKKAAKANPSVVTFYNLAVHLSNIGESADALAVAQKCQKLAPESTGVKSLVAAIESSSDHVAFSTGGTAIVPTQLSRKRRYGFGLKHLFRLLAENQDSWVALCWTVLGLAIVAAIIVKVNFPLVAPAHGGASRSDLNAPFLGYKPQNSMGAFLEIAFFLGTILASMIWTSLDLIDRRGRALWMIPMMLGCFLFLPFLPQSLYMAIGRRDSSE